MKSRDGPEDGATHRKIGRGWIRKYPVILIILF